MGWLRRLLSKGAEPTGQAQEQGPDESEELPIWSLVRATNHASGEVAIIRIRMDRPPGPEADALKTAVGIAWSFEGSMPPEPVNQQQLAFERALDELSCEPGFSELMQVCLGLGSKEWLYYTSDQTRFVEELKRLLAGHERYPLQIAFHEDPSWTLWQETVKSVKDKAPRPN